MKFQVGDKVKVKLFYGDPKLGKTIRRDFIGEILRINEGLITVRVGELVEIFGESELEKVSGVWSVS